VEIFKRFHMMYSKPMVPTLKFTMNSNSNLVDPSVYKQWIGSLMDLVNALT
jgi:hypothetical protein